MRSRDSSALRSFEHIVTQQEIAQHDPRRKNIGPFVGDLEIRLLRTHVIGLAGDDFAFVVLQEAAGLGDAKVGQFDVAREGDHDVFETDIAMDNAEGFAGVIGLGMGVGQAARHPAGDEDGQFHRQRRWFLSAS